jgi:NADH:ubiquinone oxidoreductase subunit 5 (subunit L)/multisubunit Na+/H+ antiporter MnhA subunit
VKEIKAPSFAAGAAVSLVSVAVATVALALTWRLYRRGLTEVSVDPLDVRLGPLGRLFGHAWYYDEAVTAVVGGPARRAAERLDRAVDSGGIDRVVGAVAAGVARAGTAMRALQGGFLRRYALGVLAGTVVLLGYAILRAGAG